MKRSGQEVKYINSNNFIEDLNNKNLQSSDVTPRGVDPIRFFSKKLWTSFKRKAAPAKDIRGQELFEVEELPNNVLLLKANQQKFLSEFFENGIYRKEFNETSKNNWLQTITRLIPDENEIFEDDYFNFYEPINIPELKSEPPSNINYLNREFIYNFYSPKFENLVNGTIFDTAVLPSPYNLVTDNQVDFRSEEENLILSLGGFIPGNVVDQLFFSNKPDENVKQYFDFYADTFNLPQINAVTSQITERNKVFNITKQKNNLSKNFKTNYAPFPFYTYCKFSNLANEKSDFVHVLDELGGLQNDLLNYITQIRFTNPSSNFIYSKEAISEKSIENFDLSLWLNYEIPSLSNATDNIVPIEKFVSYTNLIETINKRFKNSIRKFSDFDKPSDFSVLIYKIDKRLFSHSSKVIQTFFVVPDETDLVTFFDTQIKYGKEYFYTLSAYTLVIGNKYSYKPYVYSNDFERAIDKENGFYRISYSNKPSYKIFNVELARFSGAAIETPYTKPVIELFEDNGKVRFSLGDSSLESFEDFETIENSEFDLFELIKRSQDNDDPKTIRAAIDTKPETILQIYRITTPPSNYLSFQGRLYKTIKLDKNKNSFIDSLIPNVKFYYMFRFVNEHGIPSNASEIYEIVLKDEENFTYLETKIINLKKPSQKTDIKNFRKYLLIRPSLIQTQPIYGEDVKDINSINFGPEEKVWKKPFYLRITSKKTNRVIEFNFSAKINKKNQ